MKSRVGGDLGGVVVLAPGVIYIVALVLGRD